MEMVVAMVDDWDCRGERERERDDRKLGGRRLHLFFFHFLHPNFFMLRP
jgi:hypothetical protein